MCTTVGLVLVVVVFTRKFMVGGTPGTSTCMYRYTRHVVECVSVGG